MSRLTDKPMARASAHLAAGRLAEAAGAFRAVLHIDANEYRAHLGIADATAARGDRDGAIEGLITNAQIYNDNTFPEAALALYGRVLVLDPNRIDIHLDIAFAESALGRHDDALARVEGLAEAYLRGGRSDEAEELFRFAASWDVDAAPTAVTEPAMSAAPEPEPPMSAAPVPEPAPSYAPVETAAPHPAFEEPVPIPAAVAPSLEIHHGYDERDASTAPVRRAVPGAEPVTGPQAWRLPLGTSPQHFEPAETPVQSVQRDNTMPFYVARPGESTGEVPRLPASDAPSSRATLVPLGPPEPPPAAVISGQTIMPGGDPVWSRPTTLAPGAVDPSTTGPATIVGAEAPDPSAPYPVFESDTTPAVPMATFSAPPPVYVEPSQTPIAGTPTMHAGAPDPVATTPTPAPPPTPEPVAAPPPPEPAPPPAPAPPPEPAPPPPAPEPLAAPPPPAPEPAPPPPAPAPVAAPAPPPPPTTPEGILEQVGPPPGIAATPRPPAKPKPKPQPAPPPASSTPTLPASSATLPGPVSTPSSTPTVPGSQNVAAASPEMHAVVRGGTLPPPGSGAPASPDVTQRVPRLPDDLAPPGVDPWLGDPRAAPGGTVVARVPDGFFEAMASGDPDRIAKATLQDQRGAPLKTDAAAFARPAAPSLRRPGESKRPGKPLRVKPAASPSASRSGSSSSKPSSSKPTGSKPTASKSTSARASRAASGTMDSAAGAKKKSGGWALSSGRRPAADTSEPKASVVTSTPDAPTTPAAAAPARPEPAPAADATPTPPRKPTPARKPRPEKAAKSSSLVARLRQRAGLETGSRGASKAATKPRDDDGDGDGDGATTVGRSPEKPAPRVDMDDDARTTIASAPARPDATDADFESVETAVSDSTDDETVARAVPTRDPDFEDDQRTRLFRRDDELDDLEGFDELEQEPDE
jgi:hypothetical protein